MIIYKVSNDWNKGIKEFEIVSIKDEKTFTYLWKISANNERIIEKTFIPKYPLGSTFFLTYNEAKEYLTNRIKNSIEEMQNQIKKGINVLNVL